MSNLLDNVEEDALREAANRAKEFIEGALRTGGPVTLDLISFGRSMWLRGYYVGRDKARGEAE